MTFLGVNKQLDLQSLLTQTGRYLAYSGGWYDQRQTIQFLFIVCLSGCAVIVGIVLFRMFRKQAAEIRWASVGLCVLGAFIIIRAASFHHADKFLGDNLMGLRLNPILEMTSIIFIASSGVSYWKNKISRG